MQYAAAKKIADRIVEILTPHCHVIHIAGSIRRQKPLVKDIEIICQPHTNFITTDMFGGGLWQRTPDFVHDIAGMQQRVIKGNVQGRYMQLELKGGAIMDLFMPQPHDYYRQLAIRTGSAEYSNYVIAHSWKIKGWCGTPDGLRLQSESQRNAKTGSWSCITPDPALPPAWQSEEAFFKWLGIPCVAPSLREARSPLNIYQ